MTINPGTKTYKLFSALSNGERVSASQAQKRFGIKNISAEVSPHPPQWLCCVCKHTHGWQWRSSNRVSHWYSKPQIGCRWLQSNGTWFGLITRCSIHTGHT
jgi:hypothetical protein